jgi:GNAT superfamily N-acetyltransferase
MKADFIPLTAGAMDRALGMMDRLYSDAGDAHDRDRARRAALVLMENPDLGGIWLIGAPAIEPEAETAGYICITLGYSLEFDGRFALLDELYVEAAWRGRGIGAQAIAFAEEWSRARGLAAIRLEVARGNVRAMELYQRHGFAAHDRHLMTKWL